MFPAHSSRADAFVFHLVTVVPFKQTFLIREATTHLEGRSADSPDSSLENYMILKLLYLLEHSDG